MYPIACTHANWFLCCFFVLFPLILAIIGLRWQTNFVNFLPFFLSDLDGWTGSLAFITSLKWHSDLYAALFIY